MVRIDQKHSQKLEEEGRAIPGSFETDVDSRATDGQAEEGG